MKIARPHSKHGDARHDIHHRCSRFRAAVSGAVGRIRGDHLAPRRVTRRFRLTRAFYRSSWWLWSAVARSISDENRRETYLGVFGPLSLVMLLGVWATAIVAGFAMMHWGLETPFNVAPGIAPFSTYLYMSGTTFFTLGLGDVTPMGAPGRALVVLEAGMALAFLLPSFRTCRQSYTRPFQAAR